MAYQQPPQSRPPRPAPGSGPLSRRLMWPAGAFLLGTLLVYNSIDTPSDPKPPQARPAATARNAPLSSPPLSRSIPKRLAIPEIGVDAPFTALSIGPKGQLNAPPANDTNLVGWFQGGATPGERGASIVAGHVDTKTGPAVFLQLRMLKKGSQISITRADGLVATFKVDSVETFSKAQFPNDRVYADTPDAQLRVITCGGAYNRAAKDYESNVVVFAHLASSARK
ncbi:class F sortase [Streptomyces chattanoogensis]|uniref:Peptidase C60 n=1 Tax=Streptomyces chattanoogensis TaxID=66876 RepID=A0A0N0XTF8_9ACTN|nr:class F sortase [Streptomyces chattanoogensis]KPC59866.1 peptidase C60 [Streptomyces chattanoogensis]